MGRPVSSLASYNSLSPSSPSPWKSPGDVLGLKAPPRIMLAPAFFIFSATSIICSLFSTEHGPAMTTIFFPPIFTPSTSIIVCSFLKSLETSLYGLDTKIVFSTPFIALILKKLSSPILLISPITATTTRSAPKFS